MIIGQETRYITKESIKGFDKILLEYGKYNGGTVRQGSRAIVSYGTFSSALATAYGNTEREIYNEIMKFGLSEIAWILIDKFQIFGKT